MLTLARASRTQMVYYAAQIKLDAAVGGSLHARETPEFAPTHVACTAVA